MGRQFPPLGKKPSDNELGQFASPHPDALSPQESEAIVLGIEALLADVSR